MIKSIEIENFRCFEQTTISGFSRVNLMSGLNNSGKTALLEALYLYCLPTNETAKTLTLWRNDNNLSQRLPEKTWDNLFFNQNRQQKARLVGNLIRTHPIELPQSLSHLTHRADPNFTETVELWCEIERINLNMNGEQSHQEALERLTSGRDKYQAALHVEVVNVLKKTLEQINQSHTPSNIPLYPPILELKKVKFIPAAVIISNEDLAVSYSEMDFKGQTEQITQVIRLIDPSIAEIKPFAFDRPALYLRREGGSFLPISLFGEAIQKITNIILSLINGKYEILLIDEIENGLHHTKQRELWRMLFKLAAELQIQIFATTHSLEMIQAFRDVALAEEFEGLGAYFELARHVKTGRIVGIQHDLSTLDYALEQGLEVRGE